MISFVSLPCVELDHKPLGACFHLHLVSIAELLPFLWVAAYVLSCVLEPAHGHQNWRGWSIRRSVVCASCGFLTSCEASVSQKAHLCRKDHNCEWYTFHSEWMMQILVFRAEVTFFRERA